MYDQKVSIINNLFKNNKLNPHVKAHIIQTNTAATKCLIYHSLEQVAAVPP